MAATQVRRMTGDFDTEVSAIVHDEPEPAEAPEDREAYWLAVFHRAMETWLQKLYASLNVLKASAFAYIDAAAEEFNTTEAARWKAQHGSRRDVEPVSNYGKSNIDEAFAEVFAYYVLERELTRPQLESFRAVLKSASVLLAEKLLKAARLLTS